MTGTGDGGGMVGGSRKIKAFLWIVFAVMLFTGMATYIKMPETMAADALSVIGLAALSLLVGQSAVDTMARWKGGDAVSKTVVREQTITEKQP